MPAATTTPGPAADSAFRLGIVASVVLGLAAIGYLAWAGIAEEYQVAFYLVVVFPVYLLVVASVLSVWLGFGKDSASLRPVYRSKDSE